MKLILSFLFLLGSLLAFGQSAKKLNKKLLVEFALEQQKQDAALAIFTQTKREFDSIKKLTNKKINELSDQESLGRRQVSKVNDLINDLNDLGIDLNLVGSGYSKKEVLPEYRELVRPIKGTMKEEVNFDKVSNRLYLELYKLKEQNIMLTEKIKEYRDYSQYNSIHQQDLELNRDKLIAFSPKLDSLSTVYRLFLYELGTKWRRLMDKKDELRGNYMKKGPDGFPAAYGRIFYDVFPPAQEGSIYDMELSTSEVVEPMPEPVPDKYYKPDPVLTIVDEPASFPGGLEAMKIFIAKNLRYPESMKEAGVQGKVYLKFVVSETGEISDVKILRGLPDCKECDLEAMRVVKSMPKWIPGKNNGKPVKSYYNLPVSFKLQ